jgi:opacity protein-like surface antigen
MSRLAAACLAAAMSAACAAISSDPGATDDSGNPVSTLTPNKSANPTPAAGPTMETTVLGTALYWEIDPLTPNWQIEQASLGVDRVRISLRKKRFISGGDGEAWQSFARRAEQLARDGGYAGYTVMEYTEGVESTLPLAQRVAQGVVRLDR